MRVFCFSFIVYLMLLLTQPCQDLASMVNDCADKNTQTAHVESTSKNNPKADECSPFCICSCCSLSVADRSVAVIVSSDVKNASISSTLAVYANPYSKAHQNSVWQPPKA